MTKLHTTRCQHMAPNGCVCLDDFSRGKAEVGYHQGCSAGHILMLQQCKVTTAAAAVTADDLAEN